MALKEWFNIARGGQHKHHTIVTHLQIEQAGLAAYNAPPVWDKDISFNREGAMSIADYRALYEVVGRAWHWVNRRNLDDKALAAIIHHPQTDIFVLRQRNVAIGFVEIHRHQHPLSEIVFVGLVQNAIGQGWGSKILRYALYHLAQLETKRVIIQTCTLDHKTALPLYLKMGFKQTHTQRTIIYDDY